MKELTLKQHLRRAGQVKTEKKRLAVIKNLEKAREAKSAKRKAENHHPTE